LNKFPLELFEDYTSRMEYPNSIKKWDKPLFTVSENEELPFDQIFESITDTGKNKLRDPVSTKAETLFDENFVQELDKTCQLIITLII
jgi:tRNA uridine 5-carbamoylmethylation protein Kti12